MEGVTDKKHWQLQMESGLKTILNEKLFSDVTLKIGEQEFECHKNILCVFSSYFRCMFLSGMVESRGQVIEVGMVEAHPMGLLIQYMYTGTLNMTSHNLACLLWTATFIQMDGLLDCISRHDNLNDFINLDNFWNLWCLADTHHDCIFLKTPLKNFFLNHYEKLMETSGFLENLAAADLVSLLSNPDLMVEDEDLILRSILSWVNHDLEGRRADIPGLVQPVRLPLCEGGSLQQLRASLGEGVEESLLDKVRVAERYRENTGGQMCFTTSQSEYRPISGKKKVLILITEEKESNLVGEEEKMCYPSISFDLSEVYSSELYGSDVYSILTVLPYSFRTGGYTTCTYGESCVFLCGYRQSANAFFCYSILTDRWQRLEACPGLHRVGAQIVAVRDRVYLFGGREVDGCTLPTAVHVYNISTGHWDQTPFCHLQIPVMKYVKSCLGDEIYVFGGVSSTGGGEGEWCAVVGEDIVQCIDTVTRSCTVLCRSDLVRGVVCQGCAYSCQVNNTVHIIYRESTNTLRVVKFNPRSSSKLEIIGTIPKTMNLDSDSCNVGMVKKDCHLLIASTAFVPFGSGPGGRYIGHIVDYDMETRTKSIVADIIKNMKVVECHYLVLIHALLDD